MGLPLSCTTTQPWAVLPGVAPCYSVHAMHQKRPIAAWSLHSNSNRIASRRRSFEAGKVFGRRQSLWDLVMLSLGSRERNALGLLLQGLITTLINFTIGMVTSVFVYALRVPSLIIEYQAGLVSL